MTADEIKAEADRLLGEITKAQAELIALRKNCPHANQTKVHRSDSGNYDSSADCYWIDFSCHDCGKRWTEEGSK